MPFDLILPCQYSSLPREGEYVVKTPFLSAPAGLDTRLQPTPAVSMCLLSFKAAGFPRCSLSEQEEMHWGSEIAVVWAQGCPGHTEITEVEVTLRVAGRQMHWRTIAATLLFDLCLKEIGVGIYVKYHFLLHFLLFHSTVLRVQKAIFYLNCDWLHSAKARWHIIVILLCMNWGLSERMDLLSSWEKRNRGKCNLSRWN